MRTPHSPLRLFIVLTLSIFITELFIMIGLSYLPAERTELFSPIEPLIDGILLVLIVSPITYYYAVRPLETKIDELRQSQAAVTSLSMHDETLERDKAKDEALLTSIGEGMVATDLEGRITIVNPAAERILGLTQNELLGKVMMDVIPSLDDNGSPIPRDQRALAIALSGKKVTPFSKTSNYMRSDGITIPVAVTISPVLLEGKLIGAIEIFHDISKEREIEKMRQDLLSLASHQLRTPLSGTRWLIDTLRRGIHGPLNAKQTEYIDEIYKINERMTALVFDMLNALRIESGATSAKRETVLVSALFGAVAEMLDAAAKGRHIVLHFNGAGEEKVTTDIVMLRAIIESFVANAITYSPVGTEVFVDFKKMPTEMVFSVKDSGIGIPAKEQALIFDRFYRASNAKTFNTRGSGLGLYISAMLAEKIGARLSFESTEGKGSTFSVHLPIAASSRNTETEAVR